MPASDQHLAYKLKQDRAWLLRELPKFIGAALSLGLEVGLGCEDASRADLDFLCALAETAERAGARRLRFADTLGVLDPFGTFDRIATLRRNTGLEIEMHAHDDLGLATANTLAACKAGATHVNTTVNGLGERAGNAPLEEVVLGLQQALRHRNRRQPEGLPGAVQPGRQRFGPRRAVAEERRRRRRVHARGRHPRRWPAQASGQLPGLRPAGGRPANIASCSASIPVRGPCRSFMPDLGLTVNDGEAQALLPQVRNFVAEHKHPPETSDLRDLLASIRSHLHV